MHVLWWCRSPWITVIGFANLWKCEKEKRRNQLPRQRPTACWFAVHFVFLKPTVYKHCVRDQLTISRNEKKTTSNANFTLLRLIIFHIFSSGMRLPFYDSSIRQSNGVNLENEPRKTQLWINVTRAHGFFQHTYYWSPRENMWPFEEKKKTTSRCRKRLNEPMVFLWGHCIA